MSDDPYETALRDELESYKRAGRKDDAAAVLEALKAYEEDEAPKPKRRPTAKERADAKPAPEKAVPDPPKHTDKGASGS